MKKARITLEYVNGLALYHVTKLTNCATFTCLNGNGIKMIGSALDSREAESIALDRRFEVTITLATK